jgi:hypothetical protein
MIRIALTGCTRDEHWHQKLTPVIETPAGAVTGSVVQYIDWQGATGLYKTATQGVAPSQTSPRVTGETMAVEVAPGRWLFALFKADQGWQGEPGLNAGSAIARPLGLLPARPTGLVPFAPCRKIPQSPCPPRSGRCW